MSYTTRYSLKIIAPDDFQIMDLLRKDNDWAESCLNDRGMARDSHTWYDHEKDLRTFSKKHPKAIFELSGEGEDNGDLWRKYFLNGKMQECRAKITYSPFDRSKLK